MNLAEELVEYRDELLQELEGLEDSLREEFEELVESGGGNILEINERIEDLEESIETIENKLECASDVKGFSKAQECLE